MRVLIVDDEAAARRRLAALVEELGIEIVGEAAHGLSALELIGERRPDVVLLDVVMPEVDGFDVARHMPEPRPLVIFQTAYAEFAVKAFEHDALDYVVKPVTRERLAQAIERARRRLAGSTAIARLTPETLEQLGAVMRYRPARPERLLVRHGAGHRLVPLNDILSLSASEGLCMHELRNGVPAPITPSTNWKRARPEPSSASAAPIWSTSPISLGSGQRRRLCHRLARRRYGSPSQSPPRDIGPRCARSLNATQRRF